MATYKSKPVVIAHPVNEVYDKISNIGAYQEKLDALPLRHVKNSAMCALSRTQ